MPPKTAGWDELHLAEDPAVELLESLGYVYVAPETLEGERTSFRETILADRLAAAVERLNPWLSASNVAAAVKAVTQVPAASLAEANRKIYTSLTYGIALEQDRGGGRKSHTVRFLDFDHPDRNEWTVTRQYRVLGSKKHVIPDVVVFVNGLPLAVIECKSPTIGDAWKTEAVKQLRRYQEADTTWKDQGAPKLFEAAQILVGTCGERSVYGHGRHAGAVLPGMEAAVSPERAAARREARAQAHAAGHPAVRAPRTAERARHRPQLRRVRGRWRPHRPQADALQAVHRRERGDAADPDGAENRASGAASSGTRRGRARA